MLPSGKFARQSHLTKNRADCLPAKVKLTLKHGKFEIIGLGAWYSYWRDPYHLLLTIPWWGFLLLMVFSYLGLNGLFALAYLAGGDCIANAKPGSFWDAFFFSVQTLATIGYGAMAPITTYANIIVAIEALVSILGIALMTGLAFARFSQPTAKVIFSSVAVITPYQGIPTLMFRTANQRQNQILEAKLRVYFMRDEISAEGDFMRRLYELKLLRHRTPAFILTWTAMHPIDETSPLYGQTWSSLGRLKGMIIVSLTGIDETVAQAIHARQVYGANEILWQKQFVDIVSHTREGHRYIDFAHFHDVIAVDS